MGNFIFIIFTIGCLLFQILTGYLGNKYLGMILPVILLVFIGYLIYIGAWTWRLGDILMPFIALGALTLIYQGGRALNPKNSYSNAKETHH